MGLTKCIYRSVSCGGGHLLLCDFRTCHVLTLSQFPLFACRSAAVDLSVEWLYEVREKLLNQEYLVLLVTVRPLPTFVFAANSFLLHIDDSHIHSSTLPTGKGTHMERVRTRKGYIS